MNNDEFVLLRLERDYREQYGIPDAYLPVPMPMAADLPPEVLLRLLQEHAASSPTWQTFEPAWSRLAEELGRGMSDKAVLDIGTEDWCLSLRTVDLSQEIVTLQRGEHLIAAITPQEDGGLGVASYRPLDQRALSLLTGMAIRPSLDGSVAMRPNNWEYARDQSAGIGQAYAADEGITYISYWEHGLGLSHNGSIVEIWHEQRSLNARSSAAIAAELRTFALWPKIPRLKLSLDDLRLTETSSGDLVPR
ncbi:hypothetical protein MVG78_19875 (plasmid) [Roseomonas gilardii subsp. gilardii]|uniref:hypothetical protein n=1 Tax=Roseomonas gilardii TaxID=257708 RepID=UPI001FF8C866|nr:hypothetical protein [Roseomonas gilardii]UPG74711.1 hypothetical protein MVG78_19875 [Roseomonas gilardii subsp. gilardii]